MIKICQTCGSDYYIKPSHSEHSYSCSAKCMYLRRSRIFRREKHSAWKGGKFIANTGYVMIYEPENPRAYSNGYMLEHVFVAEKKIGRHLKNYEVVHHMNHIKTDNRPENLQVVNQFEHKSIHMKERHILMDVLITKRDKLGRIVKGGTQWATR